MTIIVFSFLKIHENEIFFKDASASYKFHCYNIGKALKLNDISSVIFKNNKIKK